MTTRQVNGGTVSALRGALGIPLGILARDAGISAGYLCNIERGRKQPTPAVTRRIADRLGVAVDAITYPIVVDAALDSPRRSRQNDVA